MMALGRYLSLSKSGYGKYLQELLRDGGMSSG